MDARLRVVAIVFSLFAGTSALMAQQEPPPLVAVGEIVEGLPADGSRWLTFGGDYGNQRHSPLTQVTPENVESLVSQWTFQTGVLGKFETTSLLRDNVLYVTGPQNVAWAIDARTGRQIWRYRRELPPDLTACCGLVNRGFAMLGDKLYMATLDAHVIALDRVTGSVVWDATLQDHTIGYAATIAPLVVKDKVIVGVAGGEYGIRGFIDAYDAETGERAWRFYTIPAPGEPGNDTWAGDSWKTGGAGVWVNGAYDPEQNLLMYGIGNPGPDYYGSVREGDNLYSNSLVALDGDTGTLRWHYQFTPHDVHDWDATEVPILADLPIAGQMRKVVMFANRNGFFYTLDRTTREPIVAKPFVTTTWAKEIGADGRPVLLPGNVPSEEGTFTCPDLTGGTNFLAAELRPGDTDILRQCPRSVHDVLRVEARICTRRAIYRRRRAAGGFGEQPGLWRAARARSGDGRTQVGIQISDAVDCRVADDGLGPCVHRGCRGQPDRARLTRRNSAVELSDGCAAARHFGYHLYGRRAAAHPRSGRGHTHGMGAALSCTGAGAPTLPSCELDFTKLVGRHGRLQLPHAPHRLL